MAIEVNNKYNKIYFSENYSELTLTATQHDTGRAFYFQVMKDDGTPYNCTGCSLTMYISIKGKAGKVNGTLINGENGRFKIIVPNSLLILNGKALMQLQLKNGKNKLGTLLGNMNIEKSIEAGATIGKDIWIDFEEIRRNVESVKNTEAYKQITELSELNADVKLTIQNGEKTITELNTHVQEAEQLKTGITAELNALNASKSEVNTVISNANTSKSDLDSRIASAESAGNTLDSKKNTVETVTIPNLNTAIETAETTKKNLDATDVKAKSTDTVVKATIENAETRNATVQTSADSKIAEVDGAITRLDNKIKEADGLFDPIEIVDNLVDGGRDKALSAEQGKELFTYASNAKEKVVSALLAKGQEVTAENTFAELAEVIQTMKIGYEVGDYVNDVGTYEEYVKEYSPPNKNFNRYGIIDGQLFYDVKSYNDRIEIVDLKTGKLAITIQLPEKFFSHGGDTSSEKIYRPMPSEGLLYVFNKNGEFDKTIPVPEKTVYKVYVKTDNEIFIPGTNKVYKINGNGELIGTVKARNVSGFTHMAFINNFNFIIANPNEPTSSSMSDFHRIDTNTLEIVTRNFNNRGVLITSNGDIYACRSGNNLIVGKYNSKTPVFKEVLTEDTHEISVVGDEVLIIKKDGSAIFRNIETDKTVETEIPGVYEGGIITNKENRKLFIMYTSPYHEYQSQAYELQKGYKILA